MVWFVSVRAQFPPVSAAKSTMTDPAFMFETISVVIRIGAFFPGIAAVVITASVSAIAFESNCC